MAANGTAAWLTANYLYTIYTEILMYNKIIYDDEQPHMIDLTHTGLAE